MKSSKAETRSAAVASMFSCIIFDLDGTLLDSLADIASSMNTVLAHDGLPVHDPAAYRYFVGDGMRTLVSRCLPEGRRDTVTVDHYYTLVRQEYRRQWMNRTRPYPGIMELLDELKRRPLDLAVLSNKPHDFTVDTIAHYFPENMFRIAWGARPGKPKKPDPYSALEMAGLLNSAPDECLYLGDTSIDMKTARAAGMYGVGVSWGFRPVDELIENGARRIIEQPSELLTLLK